MWIILGIRLQYTIVVFQSEKDTTTNSSILKEFSFKFMFCAAPALFQVNCKQVGVLIQTVKAVGRKSSNYQLIYATGRQVLI